MSVGTVCEFDFPDSLWTRFYPQRETVANVKSGALVHMASVTDCVFLIQFCLSSICRKPTNCYNLGF